jgi:hypothetical protein
MAEGPPKPNEAPEPRPEEVEGEAREQVPEQVVESALNDEDLEKINSIAGLTDEIEQTENTIVSQPDDEQQREKLKALTEEKESAVDFALEKIQTLPGSEKYDDWARPEDFEKIMEYDARRQELPPDSPPELTPEAEEAFTRMSTFQHALIEHGIDYSVALELYAKYAIQKGEQLPPEEDDPEVKPADEEERSEAPTYERITDENFEQYQQQKEVLLSGEVWRISGTIPEGDDIVLHRDINITEALEIAERAKSGKVKGVVNTSSVKEKAIAVSPDMLKSNGQWIVERPPRSPQNPERIKEVEELKKLQQRLVSGEFSQNTCGEFNLLSDVFQKNVERLEKEKEDYEKLEKAAATEEEPAGEESKAEVEDLKPGRITERMKRWEEMSEEERREKYSRSYEIRERLYQFEEARVALVSAENEVNKRNSLVGKVLEKAAFWRDDKPTAEVNEEYESALENYQEARAEYIGADTWRRLKESKRLALEEAAQYQEGKFEKVREGWRWLGEQNLEKLLTKRGVQVEGKFGKFAARMVSLRTAASLGLLGGGAAIGFGSAVGIGAIATRRVMGGMGTAFGSYDLMKMATEKRAIVFSEEKIKEISMPELEEKIAEFEVRAKLSGERIVHSKEYDALRRELKNRIEPPKEEGEEEEDMTEKVQRRAEEIQRMDALLREKGAKLAKGEKHRKVAAIGVGLFSIGAFSASSMARFIEGKLTPDEIQEGIEQGVLLTPEQCEEAIGTECALPADTLAAAEGGPGPEVAEQYIGTVEQGGHIWQASYDLVENGAITEEQFAEVWSNPESMVTLESGQEIHISETGLSHAGDQVVYVAEAGDTPAHFEVIDFAEDEVYLGSNEDLAEAFRQKGIALPEWLNKALGIETVEAAAQEVQVAEEAAQAAGSAEISEKPQLSQFMMPSEADIILPKGETLDSVDESFFEIYRDIETGEGPRLVPSGEEVAQGEAVEVLREVPAPEPITSPEEITVEMFDELGGYLRIPDSEGLKHVVIQLEYAKDDSAYWGRIISGWLTDFRPRESLREGWLDIFQERLKERGAGSTELNTRLLYLDLRELEILKRVYGALEPSSHEGAYLERWIIGTQRDIIRDFGDVLKPEETQ